jgi:hypothetical protein
MPKKRKPTARKLTPITVELKWYEVHNCALVGVVRKIEGLRQMRKPLHYFEGHDGFEIDIQGACGELAAAKAVDRYWSGSVNAGKSPDLGPYQVRTSLRENGDLVLRDNDKDEEITILVRGRAPHFEVVGWIRNRDGKRKEYYRSLVAGRPPAFVVPYEKLNPMEKLPSE